MNLKQYGSEKFNPAQLARFESYVDSRYPSFHFRRRRMYAKAVLKETNKQLITKHIYPGEKPWVSSQTLVKQLISWVKNSAARLSASIKELKLKKLLSSLNPLRLVSAKKETGTGRVPVLIGVKDLRGGKRSIKGTAAKAFHLTSRLLNTLGLSLRLNPSGFPVKILRTKPKLQHKEGVCEICGNKLGHWYKELPIKPYLANDGLMVTPKCHYVCEYEQTEEGVLL